MSFRRVHECRGAGKTPYHFLAGYTSPKPVKRWSSRAAYVGATLATATATLSTERALAHIVVRPDLIEVLDLQVELSQLRPGAPPQALELEGTDSR
jgi:hypothetical protein